MATDKKSLYNGLGIGAAAIGIGLAVGGMIYFENTSQARLLEAQAPAVQECYKTVTQITQDNSDLSSEELGTLLENLGLKTKAAALGPQRTCRFY